MSPRLYSGITVVALVALAFIVVSGGAVRLTGSGLGCPDWPTCASNRVVAPLEYHAMVEFLNRLVTGAVSVLVIIAVLGSLVRRPRRRDLVWLSLGLVAGLVAQIVLGGLVVLFHLAPPLVMAHFVVSMALLLDASVLYQRAAQPDGALRPTVDADTLRLGRMLPIAAGIVIFLGTVVTGTGPHAGSHDGQLVRRLPFDITDVARLHSISVLLFLALVAWTARALVRNGAAPRLVHRAEVLIGLVVAQGIVGYAQYFLGVPPLLVAVHVAGATAVWICTLLVLLGMRAA